MLKYIISRIPYLVPYCDSILKFTIIYTNIGELILYRIRVSYNKWQNVLPSFSFLNLVGSLFKILLDELPFDFNSFRDVPYIYCFIVLLIETCYKFPLAKAHAGSSMLVMVNN